MLQTYITFGKNVCAYVFMLQNLAIISWSCSLYIWHRSGCWSDFSYLGHSKNYRTELNRAPEVIVLHRNNVNIIITHKKWMHHLNLGSRQPVLDEWQIQICRSINLALMIMPCMASCLFIALGRYMFQKYVAYFSIIDLHTSWTVESLSEYTQQNLFTFVWNFIHANFETCE